MRLRGAYAIGICVITFDSRVRPHTAASSRFGEPSTARSHSREKRHHLRLELARACGTRTSLGCNRAWPLSSQGSDRSYGPAIRGDIAYRTNLYLNRAPSASMSPVVGCGKWIGKTYLPVP